MAKGKVVHIAWKSGDLEGPFSGVVTSVMGPKDYNRLVSVEMNPIHEEMFFVAQDVIEEGGREDIIPGDAVEIMTTKKGEPLGNTGFVAKRILRLNFL